MTKNRTLTWIAAALLVAFMAAPAMADDRQCFEDCMANGGTREACAERCFTGDDGDRDPMARFAEWLEMTEEQIGEWTALLESTGETLRPLLEEYRALEGQLAEAMRAENPDRELIGQLMLDLENLGAEIRAIQAQAIAEMIDVLTPEQVEKLASKVLGELFAKDRGGDRGGVRRGGDRHGGGRP